MVIVMGQEPEFKLEKVMVQIGTPVVACESGYVEAIGWNQYGGWRIGIRSFDKKRYYYVQSRRSVTQRSGSIVII